MFIFVNFIIITDDIHYILYILCARISNRRYIPFYKLKYHFDIQYPILHRIATALKYLHSTLNVFMCSRRSSKNFILNNVKLNWFLVESTQEASKTSSKLKFSSSNINYFHERSVGSRVSRRNSGRWKKRNIIQTPQFFRDVKPTQN